MAWLGCRQIADARKDVVNTSEKTAPASTSGSLRAGFLVGILNPKAIAFYIAFLSQFMNPSRDSLPQILILMMTSSIVVIVVLSGYALAAARARKMVQSASARRRFGYAGGGCLLGGSIVMAATR